MAGAEDGPDEFETIARLFRPLTGGSPEALDLLDDVAVLPSRPGFDLVLTADAMVEGVHFLASEPLDVVARKLLRTNLSDLAAKAAEPHGYLLTLAWPHGMPFEGKARFAAGLALDQPAFGVRLLGGDTVSTAGPFTAGMTLLGWAPAGSLVRRSGARPGDALLVSGEIGDASLGLRVLKGELCDAPALVARHRLPTPRLALREALRAYASAAADVSDGLLADAGHIGEASGLGLALDLDRTPLSHAAQAWLDAQPDRTAALLDLATGGDDYEVVCTAAWAEVDAVVDSAGRAGVRLSPIGEMTSKRGLRVRCDGCEVEVARTGWRHA